MYIDAISKLFYSILEKHLFLVFIVLLWQKSFCKDILSHLESLMSNLLFSDYDSFMSLALGASQLKQGTFFLF